mmetsp:Transcript_32179/g.76925  ORF Transcript_32179/g.76925 Transcript_32179/m.76925 type:complete len:117 (+) Transcript_32179:1877-2227(+)
MSLHHLPLGSCCDLFNAHFSLKNSYDNRVKIAYGISRAICTEIPPSGKNALSPDSFHIDCIAVTVDEYLPVCKFCFTTSYGTLENEATVFPIAAEHAMEIVLSDSSEQSGLFPSCL